MVKYPDNGGLNEWETGRIELVAEESHYRLLTVAVETQTITKLN